MCGGMTTKERKLSTGFFSGVFLTVKDLVFESEKVQKNYRDTTQHFR